MELVLVGGMIGLRRRALVLSRRRVPTVVGMIWARRGWFDKVVGYEDINCVRRQHKSSIHTDVRKLLVGHQPSNTTN